MFVINPKNAMVQQTVASSVGKVVGLSQLAHNSRGPEGTPYQTTASFALPTSVPSGAGGNINVGGLTTGINLDPMLWEVAPEQLDEEQFPYQLMRIYRDIYYFDSVAGATVDAYASLPFSSWTLTGMHESKLSKFEETLQRLNVESLLPALTMDYLIQGAFLGNMLYNKKTRLFTDMICMMPEHCKFTQMPFYGQDPIIEYTVPDKLKKFISLKSPRVTATLDRMGETLASKFKKGKFELSPLTTLFVPRTTMTNRIGTSWLKRVLPIYLVEKNLWKGTMIESTRRIRSILHVMVGEDGWEPTIEQINAVGALFTSADADPLGSIVATRAGVNTQDVRAGGDFWNIFNIWGDTVPAKLRALGISESFLSGDATLNNMETSISIFTDGLRSFRNMITHKVFYSRIFPIISMVNGYVKDGKKMPKELRNLKGEDSTNVEVLLRAIQDTSSLDMPELKWTKTLEPKGDSQYLELLEKMEEKGVPVGIRAWAAAGGMNLDQIRDEADSDLKMSIELANIKKKRSEALAKITGPQEGEGGGEDEDSANFKGEFSSRGRITKLRKMNTSDARFRTTARVKPVGIMQRNYGELSELRAPTKSGNGWKPIYNQKAAQSKANSLIIKALRNIRNKRGR